MKLPLILRRIYAEHKLTRAKKYLERQAKEQDWILTVAAVTSKPTPAVPYDSEALESAIYLLWRLSWRT